MNKFCINENSWIGVLNTGEIVKLNVREEMYQPDSKNFRILLSAMYEKLSKKDKAIFMATLTYKERDKYFEKIEKYVVK